MEIEDRRSASLPDVPLIPDGYTGEDDDDDYDPDLPYDGYAW